MQLQDKVVIVTGASSGIGLATAQYLAKEGAKVALVARSQDKLDEISRDIPGSFAVAADMSDENQIKEMVKKTHDHFKKIDILINNAGQGYDAAVEHIDPQTYLNIFKLNIIGPLVAMQQVIPIMRTQGEGTIVNISSGTALMFLPSMSAYSSIKRALVGLSLTAREELKPDKITVSVVYPYITKTDFEKNTIKHGHFEATSNADDEKDLFQPPDTAEYVAGKIAEVIESGDPEMYVHDWMKNIR